MKIFKYISIILLSLVALVLVSALFIKNEFAVERQIVIHKPNAQVFNFLRFLKSQDEFSVWALTDSNMEKSMSGKDGMVGAISRWKSNNKDLGTGEQEIIGIVENKQVDLELRFKEPFESKDHAYFLTEAQGDSSTLVKWGFDGRMDYPTNFLLPIIGMEDELGGMLQTGLDKLKIVLEK